ncbi:UNKNOWN [Stylonychia lemnae]|uniref:Uncharacterized protein n=1 Tax=Stylonychia lemnae TaxID=5949 RepID=A0A078AVT5_STYLE|nr:UNKNOWN [Stylonychia lemnae]|eukprot:CDW85362.1 UNKNOWN [Stylonychia lemnae]
MVYKLLSLVLLKCSIISQIKDSDFNIFFIRIPNDTPLSVLDQVGQVSKLHQQSFDWQHYDFMRDYQNNRIQAVANAPKQVNYYTNIGSDNLFVFYDSNHNNESTVHTIVEDLQLQMDFDLLKIDFNPYHGFIRDDVTFNQVLSIIKEGKLPYPSHVNGTIRKFDSDSGLKLLERFRGWRNKPASLIQYNFKFPVMKLNPKMIIEKTLPSKGDLLIFFHSNEYTECQKHNQQWNTLAKHFSNVQGLNFAEIDFTSDTLVGEWFYQLPMFFLYKKGMHYKSYQMEANLKTQHIVQYLKNNSQSYKSFVNNQIEKRAIMKKQDYYVFQNYCAPIYTHPQSVALNLKHQLLDYDDIVTRDVNQNIELVGYALRPFEEYRGQRLGSEFLEILRFDNSMAQTKAFVVRAPLFAEQRKQFWALVKDGYMPIGMMGYMSYPKYDSYEAFLDDKIPLLKDSGLTHMFKAFAGWLHSTKEPGQFIGNQHPRLRFSESDLQYYIVDTAVPKNITQTKKDIDLLYIINDEEQIDFHMKTQNWKLALASFEKIANSSSKIKVVSMGKQLPKHLKGKIIRKKFVEQNEEFYGYLARAKVLFVPSVHNSSPKLITQALTLDTAVLVNQDIIGGWNYVNEQTGAFFKDENDILPVLKDLIKKQKEKKLSPRQWYQNYFVKQPKRLQAFVELLRWEYKKPQDDLYYMQ